MKFSKNDCILFLKAIIPVESVSAGLVLIEFEILLYLFK